MKKIILLCATLCLLTTTGCLKKSDYSIANSNKKEASSNNIDSKKFKIIDLVEYDDYYLLLLNNTLSIQTVDDEKRIDSQFSLEKKFINKQTLKKGELITLNFKKGSVLEQKIYPSIIDGELVNISISTP
ncbi:hypothetical protein ACWOFR_10095 [Carnobacterium gallinarum]|uniref:hypothetical protein n=1 Tax=Carnobacterium gallinarum TaxID=2749 RepID=UPI00054F2BD8|nr:hypothetical protein [Carnobacterium gallinarum]